MTSTILDRATEATRNESPETPPPTRTVAALLGWVLVLLALVVATVVAVRAFGSDGDPSPAPRAAVEQGSIAAIDHAAEQQARSHPFVETGSIAALDHAASEPRPPWYAEHGSIAAIDHGAQHSTGSSWYSAEHGSISAADHAADGASEDG